MEAIPKHRPLPWHVSAPMRSETGYEVYDAEGNLVANCGGWYESANVDQDAIKKGTTILIVQACNSHDALVATVKQAMSNCSIDNHGGTDNWNCPACNQYRAALKLAGEA